MRFISRYFFFQKIFLFRRFSNLDLDYCYFFLSQKANQYCRVYYTDLKTWTRVPVERQRRLDIYSKRKETPDDMQIFRPSLEF